jgi:choline dehydrogenase-like flavoprotein
MPIKIFARRGIGMEERQSHGTFDYVVIGAGTAGCLLANRLSANPENRVLLLEAGGKDNWHWIHIPVGYLYTMMNPRTDWCFKTVAEKGLNGRVLDYPRGKVLGGCSSINGMIYMRGQARDYDGWRQLGAVGWAWDDVLPYFRRTEDFQSGADELHGAGGEWRVEEPRLSWEILDAFREAAVQAGIPAVDDFNRGNNEGVGYFHVNQRRGIRWNASKAFLRPIASRQNLTVATNAQVERLEIAEGRATAVSYDQGGHSMRAEVSGEVVLAAGSIGTPHILHLSGIGPGEWLQKIGVGVVANVDGVGRNLQDHLQVRLAYKVHGVKTLNEQANSLMGKVGMGLNYALFRRGPLTMAPSQLGCFAKSDPSRETPNLQYHVQPLSLEKFGEPLHPFPAFTASVCNLRPESRGEVKAASPDFRVAPKIHPNYLSDPADRIVAAQAVRLTRHIASQPAMQRYRPEEFKPGPQIDGDEELARAAGDIATTIFHPVGTARMGEDAGAPVDSRLRLKAVANVRIADASVMPTITSGNTNSPTLMIAEKGAEMILADAK